MLAVSPGWRSSSWSNNGLTGLSTGVAVASEVLRSEAVVSHPPTDPLGVGANGADGLHDAAVAGLDENDRFVSEVGAALRVGLVGLDSGPATIYVAAARSPSL